MNSFVFENEYIKLQFEINNDKSIRLIYLGTHKNYLKCPSTFVEIETSENDHLGSHCFKQCNTPYGSNAKYISHKTQNNELVIVTSDKKIKVETHILLYKDCAGLTVYNIVENVSNVDVHLEYVSSFYLYGLGQKYNPIWDKMNVLFASNSWNTEAQVSKQSFTDANIFNGNNRLTMKKFVINNTGSWSTKEYLPVIGIENELEHQFILAQIENNGSWHIELGDNENAYYVSLSGPEMTDNQWHLLLKPNQAFTTVSASIVFDSDYESSVQQMTKLRRHLIDKKHPDYKLQPVIFNDFMHGTWDQSSEQLLKPYIDVASEVGADVFVVDAGWFSKTTGWGTYIGDYVEASENYPNGGLKGLFDYIRRKGLKAGLWFEIENIGINSDTAKNLSEECFIHLNGSRIIRNSRYCLNLTNSKAFEWAYNKLADAIEKYNLDYIKIDYNLDLGVGGDDDNTSLGEFLLRQNKALIKLIKKIHDKYPLLTIENCASGGQRLDYAMLRETQLASTSDLENYRLYPNITGNIYLACLPEQAGIWSYPVCNDNQKLDIDDEVVIYNMVNGLAGRLTLSSKLYLLNNEQLMIVKEGVKFAKQNAEFMKNALPVYPCGYTRFFEPSVVFGLLNEKKMLLYVFNSSDSEQQIFINLQKYKIKEFYQVYPKSNVVEISLKDNRLCVNFKKPYMGRIIELHLK